MFYLESDLSAQFEGDAVTVYAVDGEIVASVPFPDHIPADDAVLDMISAVALQS